MQYTGESTSVSVQRLLEKLNYNKRFTTASSLEGFGTLGVEKNIQMGAREVIAVQTLLNVNVTNRRALLHE